MPLGQHRRQLLAKLARVEAEGEALRRDFCRQVGKLERGLAVLRWALALLPMLGLGGRGRPRR
jgi:biopolymer transport protein ExbB/TolQ